MDRINGTAIDEVDFYPLKHFLSFLIILRIKYPFDSSSGGGVLSRIFNRC